MQKGPRSPRCRPLLHVYAGTRVRAVGMAAAEVEKLDELVKERVRLEKGKTLYSLDHPSMRSMACASAA